MALTASPHRIKRAVFDIRYPSESAAFQGREYLQELCDTSLTSVLESCLDRISRDEVTHRIHRLEIDLGQLSPDQLRPDQLKEVLLRVLTEQLTTAAAEHRVEVEEPVLETILLEFLETGRLPWRASGWRLDRIESETRRLPEARRNPLMTKLRSLIRGRAPRRRLLQQFSPGFARWVIERLQPAAAGLLKDVPPSRLFQLSDSDLPALDQQKLGAILFEACCITPGQATVEDLKEALFRAVQRQKSIQPDPTSGSASSLGSPVQAGTSAGEDDYTDHAGIVLLHPFLPRFFQTLELLDPQQQFPSRGAQERAVHLLFYLACGQQHPEEHQTVLHKALCGCPLQYPLRRQLELDSRETQEAENLLQASIGHWKKLKTTSPDGLREGFLQRKGRLSQQGSGWRLVVEQKGIDLLLDYLPWTLSHIRLPWMSQALTVDWA